MSTNDVRVAPHASLLRRVVAGEAQLFVAMAAILVLASWSLSYWQGWAFLLEFTLGMGVVTAYCLVYDPALLERRMRAGPAAEPEPAQKVIQTLNVTGTAGLLVVPGIDHHFGWSSVPLSVQVAGHLMTIACFAGWLVVFRENTFASSIVEVVKDQHVVDTGVYSFVRHPMYTASLLLFFGAPLALGSYWTLLLSLVLLGGIVARLLHEERFLAAHLPGYADYLQRSRWRLVPKVW